MRRTDWNAYYAKPYPTAVFSRWVTGGKLIRLMRRFLPKTKRPLLAELGGANSCFYDLITWELQPTRYLVVDNNRLGLRRLAERASDPALVLRCADVLREKTPPGARADLVFSVGLIEHFDAAGTAKCIAAHFKYLKPGGICLMTFPTPTWLYRATRWCSESLGLWIFHDERPLLHAEVEREARRHGTILHRSTTWATFLTQGVLVIRRFRSAPARTGT